MQQDLDGVLSQFQYSRFFIAFTYFAVLNVLTAVFCQTAIESAQNDQTTMVHTMISNKNAILAKLQSLFYEIGSDGCDRGQLTLGAFETKMKNPEVHDFLESLGLNVWDAWSFFKLLDADGGGAVDIEEFFQGCLRHRGAARSMDVGKIIQDQEWIIHNQGKFQVLVQDDLAFVKEKLLTLAELLRSESSESDENEPGINEK
ncbi:para [Symbiodinium sp. CCMP2592]|nr:para [Symbiodinium sp. CCMP2592]